MLHAPCSHGKGAVTIQEHQMKILCTQRIIYENQLQLTLTVAK